MSDIVSAALANENIDTSDNTGVADTTPHQPEVTSDKTVEEEASSANSDPPKTSSNNNTSPNTEDLNSQDAENQIAAVLTQMQNAGGNMAAVAPGYKSGEGTQESFEPSIAVIMQDESATANPQNATNQGQIQLTPHQLEVMQSGQIPSQASMYTLGNIVLILSPDVMASGGLTQEQIQQIQESQASAALSNSQEDSAINLNVEGSANAQPVVQPPTTTSTKESTPTDKKVEEAKDKDKAEDIKTTKDVSKAAPVSQSKASPTDLSKSTPTIISKQGLGSAEKQKAVTESTSITGKSKEEQSKSSKEASGNTTEKSSKILEKEKNGEGKADPDKEKLSVQVLENKREFKCGYCDDSFDKKEQLESHVKTHNRRKRGRQPASQPAKTSPESESKPSRPKRSKAAKPGDAVDAEDDKSEADPFHCEVCGDSFSAELKLRKHLTTHNVNKRLHCDGCKVPFAFQYQLDRHIRRNTGEQPYKCDKCEESFPLRCHFNYHLRLHNPKKLHECEHCGKTFNSIANLRGHIRIHTGEKPYKCDICEKCFTEYSSLAKHRRSHTGERPFKCIHCEKAFTQSGGLKAHLRTHTGERPFKCEHCERSFAKDYNLKTHRRTHTGEKPYKCDICGILFSQHSTLAQHIRRHQSKVIKSKVTIGQQTTGNPEMDVVESHPVPQSDTIMQQEQQQPTADASQQPTTEVSSAVQTAVEDPKSIQSAAVTEVSTQEGAQIIITETVVNERTEAEELAALQEASQAIQMLQMQQLVNQVEEVVTQAAALSQINQT